MTKMICLNLKKEKELGLYLYDSIWLNINWVFSLMLGSLFYGHCPIPDRSFRLKTAWARSFSFSWLMAGWNLRKAFSWRFLSSYPKVLATVL